MRMNVNWTNIGSESTQMKSNFCNWNIRMTEFLLFFFTNVHNLAILGVLSVYKLPTHLIQHQSLLLSPSIFGA